MLSHFAALILPQISRPEQPVNISMKPLSSGNASVNHWKAVLYRLFHPVFSAACKSTRSRTSALFSHLIISLCLPLYNSEANVFSVTGKVLPKKQVKCSVTHLDSPALILLRMLKHLIVKHNRYIRLRATYKEIAVAFNTAIVS